MTTICLSGHHEKVVEGLKGTARKIFFPGTPQVCTTSLQLFEYVSFQGGAAAGATDLTNLTIWNASAIAGPIRGGTSIVITGRKMIGEKSGAVGLPDKGADLVDDILE